jgi:hypothetical protein
MKSYSNQFHVVATVLFSMLLLVQVASAEQVSGELKVWHKVTITFDGPQSSVTATPNPFIDYRLNVTFARGVKKYVVPGYFSADGDAANTSADDL